MSLKRVPLGDLEIETNCPYYSVHVTPGDFKTGDPLKFVCEDKEDGTNDCNGCMLANIAAILMHIRDIEFTVMRELQGGNRPGGLVVPTIKTRK